MQAPLCRHIKSNGIQCQALALSGSVFCYFHRKLNEGHRLYRTTMVGKQHLLDRGHIVALPALEDVVAVQLGLSEVINALACNFIDAKRAYALLYGLQIASTNAGRVAAFLQQPTQVVRQCSPAPDINECVAVDIAPAGRTCEVEDAAQAPAPTGEDLSQDSEPLPLLKPAQTTPANQENQEPPAGNEEPTTYVVDGITYKVGWLSQLLDRPTAAEDWPASLEEPTTHSEEPTTFNEELTTYNEERTPSPVHLNPAPVLTLCAAAEEPDPRTTVIPEAASRSTSSSPGLTTLPQVTPPPGTPRPAVSPSGTPGLSISPPGTPRPAIASRYARAIDLASRYAKASALALSASAKKRGFSPWGMPSSSGRTMRHPSGFPGQTASNQQPTNSGRICPRTPINLQSTKPPPMPSSPKNVQRTTHNEKR